MQEWRRLLTRDPAGFYLLDPAVTHGVPVRLFLTEALLEGAEEGLYQQILNACAFPGVRAVAITPDIHFGCGVPVGCDNRRRMMAATICSSRAQAGWTPAQCAGPPAAGAP